jgi:hypothetical protein
VAAEHHVLPVAVLMELAGEGAGGLPDAALEREAGIKQHASPCQAISVVEVIVLIANKALVETADRVREIQAVQAVRQMVDVRHGSGVVVARIADPER